MSKISTQSPSLFELLTEPTLGWQVHNCKSLQVDATFDKPMSLLNHYDSLPDDIKAKHPLSFSLLKQMNEPMTAPMVEALLGLPARMLKQAWHIKYVGRTVFFCEAYQLAVRVHFSNTSKESVAIYAPEKATAWQAQSGNWRFFGVVDLLYKGAEAIVLPNGTQLSRQDQYQALTGEQSVLVVEWLNEQKLDNSPAFRWLIETLNERVLGWLP